MIRAGRGFGKTRSGSEWIHDRVARYGARRIALVGRSAADVRDVMVEGPTGIMPTAPPDFHPIFEPTKRRITWPNGAVATTFTAEEPSLLRGPEHDTAWCDELSSWTDAHKGDRLDTAYNNLMLGLRSAHIPPRCLITTTPKSNRLTREISNRPSTVLTLGSTFENIQNLADAFREEVIHSYEGTRIGRQELMGELLDDTEGALFALSQIEACRGQLVGAA